MNENKWTPVCIVTKQGRAYSSDMLNEYITSESKQLSKDVFAERDYGINNLVKPLYDPLPLAKLTETNVYHMRACRTKSEDVAGNGYRIYPKVDNPNEGQKEIIEEFINSQPESLMEIFKKLQYDKETTGYFCMEIAREFNKFDGKVNLINHIPSYTMRIHKSGNKYCQKQNNKKVWFRNFNYGKDVMLFTGEETEINQDRNICGNEIIWSINYTPRSHFYGVPDVIPAIGAIAGDISRRNYNIAFFNNCGIPAYLVSITGNYDPGEINPETGKTPLVERIEEKFQELSTNPQSIMILTIPTPQGTESKIEVKIEPLSTEVKDASFRLYRYDNRDEVIAAHGMPPYRMGIYETGQLAGNLGRESTLIYYQSIIQPRQQVFNDIMNLMILPTLEITDYVFELEKIDVTEVDADVNRVMSLISCGVMSPNDAIRYLGEFYGLEVSDDPAMDFHYIQGRAIDGGGLIPESEITGALESIKDKLIEALINHVTKTANGNLDRDRRFTKAITDIQKDIKSTEGRA